jgi:hypothetical protein
MNFDLITDLAFYLPALPAVLAVFKWQYMRAQHRWFAILLWVTMAISFSSHIWLKTTEYNNNLPFFHSYILVEFLLFLMVFKHIFIESIKDYIWWLLASAFTILWLINVFTGQGWWGFPDYIHAVEAVIVLVLVVKWFLKMLKEKKVANPERTFEFWMCVGLLLFFAGSFLLFIFSKFLVNNGAEVFKAIWMINGILTLLLYTSYTIALLWVKKKVN